ncbi:Transmembrane protein [Paragonimus heterotremus]|uniref:Transmembrane protein 186 n=1 Tax=Paragonimus heterotremus TaxID=100268 RepID=A0A8J4T986_9TREM|nr:Transmembrane protein [Paragonimus heterotremus]
MGSAAFSVCSLAAFSYFSTKLIGVVSVHRPSGLIRLGHLNFWGRRANTMVHLENLVPPTDFADNPEDNQTVRVGILKDIPSSGKQSNRIERAFFLTRLRAEIVDREQFSKILGFLWT